MSTLSQFSQSEKWPIRSGWLCKCYLFWKCVWSTDLEHWVRLLGVGDGRHLVSFLKQLRAKSDGSFGLNVISTEREVEKNSCEVTKEGQTPRLAAHVCCDEAGKHNSIQQILSCLLCVGYGPGRGPAQSWCPRKVWPVKEMKWKYEKWVQS